MLHKRLRTTFVIISLAVLGYVAAQSIASSNSQNVPPRSVWFMLEGRDVSAEVNMIGARSVQLVRTGDEYSRSQDESIVMAEVPLGRGTTADFRLEPFDVFTADARLVAMAGGVEMPLPRPTVKLYRGESLDGSGGHMFLSVDGSELRAVIDHGGEMTYILPARSGGEAISIVVPGSSLPPFPLDDFCGADLLPENRAAIERFSEGVDQPLSESTTNRLEADLMIDVSYSLYANVFGRKTATATNYATSLIGAASAIYQRDVNVQLRISALTVWTTQDPFTGASASDQLTNYRNYVAANRSGVSRDIAHLLANGNVTNYGGVAFVDVLCSNSYGYAVSNIYGDATFPAPGYEWDIFVVSHEMGHNFGSLHTHCYSPPIDMCYSQESGCYTGPVVPSTGTLMSYCHLTSGGVNLVFHQRTIDVIRPRAEAASCFSVVAVSPSIAVSAPNGGENWQVGASKAIQWTSGNITGNVKIELSRDGGATWETLFADTSNDGSENWTVAGATTTQARVKVSSVADPTVSDTSNANFTISVLTQPSIRVTVPNGGEWWQSNTTQTITWTSTGISGNVKISISRNGGGSYKAIFSSVPNTGSVQWTVSGATTTQARIQVVSIADSTVQDASDANFTISSSAPPTPGITVAAPNGGESWALSTAQTIKWTSSSVSGNVKIELSRSGSGGPFETLFASTANDGSENWTVAGTTSSNCFVRVSSIDSPSYTDLSNTAFSIVQQPPALSITVVAPNGGESWPVGSTQTIRWTSTSITGNVKIRLSRDGGSSYKTLFNSAPNTGSIQWKATSPASSQCKIEISGASGSVRDLSDNTFSITP